MYRNASIVPEAATSFEDLMAKAQEATEGDILGANLEYGHFFAFAHLNAVGGQLMDEAGDPLFNDENGVEWLNLLNSFKDAGPVEWYTDNDVNLFKAGQVGVIIDGTWNLSGIVEVLDEEIVSIDPWPTGMSGYVQNDNLYLNANAEGDDKAATWAFMQYLESPDAQKMIAENNTGFIPNVAGVEVPDRLRQEAVIAFEGGVAFPVIPEMGAYWGPMETAIRSVVDEGTDPAVTLQTALDAIVPAIAEIRGE
jgi:arabinogalactan oligomer/maltooligosaccharide transport system substrate-binding protein